MLVFFPVFRFNSCWSHPVTTYRYHQRFDANAPVVFPQHRGTAPPRLVLPGAGIVVATSHMPRSCYRHVLSWADGKGGPPERGETERVLALTGS